MEINKEKTVAFTGYRTSKILSSKKIPDLFGLIELMLYNEITELCEKGYDTFLTGMAEGFDLMAGKAVLRVKKNFPSIKLVAVVPFRGQEDRFTNQQKKDYNKVLDNADSVICLSERYDENVFLRRNDFLLDNCEVVLCYYTGLRGGTMYTYNRAKTTRVVINIAEKI